MRIILTSFDSHCTGGIRTRQGKVGVVLSGKRQRSEKAVRESSSNLLGESQFEIPKVANPWCEIPRYTFYYPGENKNRGARLCRDPIGRGVALHHRVSAPACLEGCPRDRVVAVLSWCSVQLATPLV